MSGNTRRPGRIFKYGVITYVIILRIPVSGLDTESTYPPNDTTDVRSFPETSEAIISPNSSLSEEEYLNRTGSKRISTESVRRPIRDDEPWGLCKHMWYQPDPSKSNRVLFDEATYYACGMWALNDDISEVECVPCHSDDECHYFGDCCTGVAFLNSDDSPTKSFPFLTCSRDNWTQWENFTNIFMVSVCPEDSDVDTATKCHSPDISVQKEATPVGTPNTYVTYRNAYCANCHGVTDYKKWRHEVRCSLGSKIQRAKSKEELWRLVLDDDKCSIISHPPETVSLRKCYPVEYDTCNATGTLLSAPEPVVESLCGMYTHPVYSDKHMHSNVFCAMCNGLMLDKCPPIYQDLNKEDTKISTDCGRTDSFYIPCPLTMLLDFNPESEAQSPTQHYCDEGTAFDPFSKSCKNISCGLRRALVGNDCKEIFSSASGLGLLLDVWFTPTNASLGIPVHGVDQQYIIDLSMAFSDFTPVVIAQADFHSINNNSVLGGANMLHVSVNLVSTTHRRLSDLENSLLSFMNDNFSYVAADGTNVTLLGQASLCSSSFHLPTNFTEVSVSTYHEALESVDPMCAKTDCFQIIDFEPIQLKCPYLEFNISQSEFSFYEDNRTIIFKDFELQLSPNHFVLCEGRLKICLEDIANIMSWLATAMKHDLTLSIVSLVCQTLSLVGLALTFLAYSLLPKLRTFPGKNTMALVFHLFLAQLLFLTTSGRTDNAILCQVFGVLIHYFWLSSFSWMAVSAYHMHSVFTSIRTHIGTGNSDRRRLVRYSATCVLLPSCVVAICLSVYLIPSRGTNSGYGGTVCFLNSPTAIGCFFAAPLILMLIFNGVLFIRTILAIRSVPDLTKSSNVSNKHHVVVYIKLSLMFGFTWTFGIVAELVPSDVLSYLFVILTGSQGIMLFLAYCLKRRTWTMLQVRFGHRGEHSRSHSNNDEPSYTYTISNDVHSSPNLHSDSSEKFATPRENNHSLNSTCLSAI